MQTATREALTAVLSSSEVLGFPPMIAELEKFRPYPELYRALRALDGALQRAHASLEATMEQYGVSYEDV